jgi:hypothetical protein
MSGLRKRYGFVVLGLVAVVAAAFGAFQIAQHREPAPPLAGYLPQGALLTIESPDFATLVNDWKSSPQAAAWLKSDDYSVYSRSRLFGRLTDAQAQFWTTAGLPKDLDLLHEVAGKQSIFAWYDIGNLEFLYITKLPPGQAEQTHLMQARAAFSRRQVGNAVFYVRTQAANANAAPDEQSDADASPNPAGPTRTVAFATSGDWLLLSTREDLMAGGLQLLERTTAESVATEPWYADAQKLAATESAQPALHMTLALDRIARTPQFRSYWIQQNITDLSHYRAAVSDLYREPSQLREERVLVPKAAPDEAASTTQLAALVALVPPGTGVFRAHAAPTGEQAAAAIEEKLLGPIPVVQTDDSDAPDPDLSQQTTGSTSDLEVRIDAVDPAPQAPSKAAPDPLAEALASQHLDAILTLDTASAPPEPGGIWVPFHSAVVLHASQPIVPAALQQALTARLNATLSAGSLGVAWTEVAGSGHKVFALTGAHTLALYVGSNVAILTDAPALLTAMLAAHTPLLDANAVQSDRTATYIAGFDHASQRAPFARWTRLVDRAGTPGNQDTAPNPETVGTPPPFFSGNLRSLSNAFAAFQCERMVERPDGANIRQTVTWHYQP